MHGRDLAGAAHRGDHQPCARAGQQPACMPDARGCCVCTQVYHVHPAVCDWWRARGEGTDLCRQGDLSGHHKAHEPDRCVLLLS